MNETEKLLLEIRDELRKSTSILEKVLKAAEQYFEYRKARSR